MPLTMGGAGGLVSSPGCLLGSFSSVAISCLRMWWGGVLEEGRQTSAVHLDSSGLKQRIGQGKVLGKGPHACLWGISHRCISDLPVT